MRSSLVKFRRVIRHMVQRATLGMFRRTRPLSDGWGYDRGTPVDRYYIEQFLKEQRLDIRGHVLEVKDSSYTERYGSEVVQRDVLDINGSNPRATVVADLAAADLVRAELFDCFILSQTLQFIYDTQAAVGHAHRILRPGGVLLVTVPTISRIAPRVGLEGDYWRFTAAACATLFGSVFGAAQVTIHSYGNVGTATAFLQGMAYEELSPRMLTTHDPYFPVIIAVRAVKEREAAH